MTKKDRVPNKEFATKNREFLAACKAADVEPTARQASKWRNKQGIARLSLKRAR